MSALTNIITLDGFKYAVKSNTYTRTWNREFSTAVTAGVIRLSFVDRGAGIMIYKMSLELRTWPAASLPYQLGVTQTWDAQMANLETTYRKTATAFAFTDPLGNQPVDPATGSPTGVYFLNYVQTIPNYATPDKPSIIATIELENAAGIVIGP